MSNQQHLAILKLGAEAWNKWRWVYSYVEPDLRDVDLHGADLRDMNLHGADLSGANLRRADLFCADLHQANLKRANMSGADLLGADLSGADLLGADLSEARLIETTLNRANLQMTSLRDARLQRAELSEADLRGANLRGADLGDANLGGANLQGADLCWTILVGTRFVRATLSDCAVYGAGAWDVELDGAVQANLSINAPDESTITVDNLEVAQFLYLMLHNDKVRDVIDTLTSKVVLILGRFTSERKAVLDALREALRRSNYVPVLFDFDTPSERNVRETVTLLARMARFIIADLTEPSSIPLELEAIVSGVTVPVQPLIAQDARPFSMFGSLRVYPWLLPIYRYANVNALLAALQAQIIAPAEAKVREVRRLRLVAEGEQGQ